MNKICTAQFAMRLLLLITMTVAGTHLALSQVTIKGTVNDETGAVMPGVNIIVQGTAIGTTTDAAGKYSLSINTDNAVLTFSFIGYNTVNASVDSRTVIDIAMTPDITSLTELVVTALGVEREKRELTYSTQEVKGEELIRAKEPNIINSLTGKVSGVQITNSSGTPGSSTRIVIRGASSISGENQALIVIDGVPVDNSQSTSPTGGALGAGSSRLNDIDPSIVESVNVLKGAAATALYGSAGARGVLMITTKTGGNRKPEISFSSDVSFEKGIFPDRVRDYAQGTGGNFFDGESLKTSTSYGPRLDTLRINGAPIKTYDPYDFFQTGVTTNNNISIRGGNESSSYLVSYSYFDQKGITPNSGFERHSIFAKYSTKIYKNLTTVFQLQYSSSNQARPPEGAGNGPLFVLYGQPVSWNPFPVLNPDGTQRMFRFSRNHPWWAVDNASNNLDVNRYLPEITINYTPFSWLTITERAGMDMYTEQLKYWENPSLAINTFGRIIDQNVNFRQFNHDLIVNAEKAFGDFNLNLLLGNNIFSTYRQTNNITGEGLNVKNFYNVSSASTINSFENHSLRRKVGFYAQANVDYKKIFILSLTGRYDGSSVLSKEQNFYPYGSVAGSFIFSELFGESSKSVFSFGKLRVSYATVGSENVAPYSLTTPYIKANITNMEFPISGQSGFLLSQTLGNPDLKNERMNESEIGIETMLFNNRIGFEASYFYRKITDGLIPGVQIAASTGYTGTTVNTATMENKGIEMLLNASPIKGDKFSWDVTLNFTRIRNEVLFLYPGLEQLSERIVVGEPYGVFMGSRYQRNASGQIVIGADGMPLRDPELGKVGDANPDWLAGMSNTLRFGSVSLNFFFDMKKGGDLYNEVDNYGYFYGSSIGTLDRSPKVIEGVTADGQPNTVPVNAELYYKYVPSIRESMMQDGTYIKLRNVSLAYDVRPSLLARTPLKSLSLIITGRNLWIHSPNFTGADPEVSTYGSANDQVGVYSFSTPTSRSINFTLRGRF
jgi:TonB-linked SusC/RagA family outer membrane protein